MTALAPPVVIDEYYELRLYKMIPTRMPEFHDLMGVQVPPIFARHGIAKPLGFWESHGGRLAPLFAYIIPWSNLDARMAAWRRFYADPDDASQEAPWGFSPRGKQAELVVRDAFAARWAGDAWWMRGRWTRAETPGFYP